MKHNWYPIDKSEKRTSSSADLEEGLTKALIKRQESKRVCDFCNGKRLRYQGLGIYLCLDCKKETKTAYGKVREYIDDMGPCTMMELMDGTGLSKEEIEALVESGSIEFLGGGLVRFGK